MHIHKGFKYIHCKCKQCLAKLRTFHYSVTCVSIPPVRQGTLSVLPPELHNQRARWRRQAGAPGKVRGGVEIRPGDANDLFLPSYHAVNPADPGVPIPRQGKTPKRCSVNTGSQEIPCTA